VNSFHEALSHQPKIDLPFDNDYAKIIALPFFAFGAILVFGAYYRYVSRSKDAFLVETFSVSDCVPVDLALMAPTLVTTSVF
jgi:hypothetical protein